MSKLIYVDEPKRARADKQVEAINVQVATLKRVFKNTIGKEGNIQDILDNGGKHYVAEFWKAYSKLYPPISNAQKVFQNTTGVLVSTLDEKIETLRSALKKALTPLKIDSDGLYSTDVSEDYYNVYLSEEKVEEYNLALDFVEVVERVKETGLFSPINKALQFAPSGWFNLNKGHTGLDINHTHFKA